MCEWEQHWKKWYIQFHVLSLKLWWLKILQDFSNPFGSLALPSIFPVKVKNSGEWYLRWGYLDLASWLKKLFIYSLLLTLTTEEKQATGNVLFSFLVYTKIVCSVTGGTQFFLFFSQCIYGKSILFQMLRRWDFSYAISALNSTGVTPGILNCCVWIASALHHAEFSVCRHTDTAEK